MQRGVHKRDEFTPGVSFAHPSARIS